MSFKQFNPNKPAKYGLLKRCEVPIHIFVCAIRYEDGGYYLKGTELIVQSLANQMEEVKKLAGRNTSFDILYTSISLAEWLQKT